MLSGMIERRTSVSNDTAFTSAGVKISWRGSIVPATNAVKYTA